jgi:undecaprenyl-diphosphatase
MQLRDFHGEFDLWLLRALNRDGGAALDAVMRLLSTRAFDIACGLLLVALIVVRRRRAAAPALFGLAVALAVSDFLGARLLRPLFGRMRPCYALAPGMVRWLAPAANAPSLPSLHASNMFALAYVVARSFPALTAPTYLLAAAVSLSRVYLGVHWPTDVAAGALYGTLAGVVGLAVGRRFARGWREPLPPGASGR